MTGLSFLAFSGSCEWLVGRSWEPGHTTGCCSGNVAPASIVRENIKKRCVLVMRGERRGELYARVALAITSTVGASRMYVETSSWRFFYFILRVPD